MRREFEDFMSCVNYCWSAYFLKKIRMMSIIIIKVNWFWDKKLGCKKKPSTAITCFFVHNEQEFILEDDCVPNLDFFLFVKIY